MKLNALIYVLTVLALTNLAITVWPTNQSPKYAIGDKVFVRAPNGFSRVDGEVVGVYTDKLVDVETEEMVSPKYEVVFHGDVKMKVTEELLEKKELMEKK